MTTHEPPSPPEKPHSPAKHHPHLPPSLPKNWRRLVRWLHQKGVSRRKLRNHSALKSFGHRLFSRDLWRFNVHSVSWGWLLGCLGACHPFMGLQITTTLPFNLIFRANVPITILLILTTNPATAPFYYPFAFWIGCLVMHTPLRQYNSWSEILTNGWAPLMVGCFTIGITLGLLGFLGIRAWGHWRDKVHARRSQPPAIGT